MDVDEAQELINSVAESDDERPHAVPDNNNKQDVDEAKSHSESEKTDEPKMGKNDENMEVEEDDANRTADSITDDANETADSTVNLNDSETVDSIETAEQLTAVKTDSAVGEAEGSAKVKKKGRSKMKKTNKSRNHPRVVRSNFVFKNTEGGE